MLHIGGDARPIVLLCCNFLLHETLTGKLRNVSVSAQPTTKGYLLKWETLSNNVDIHVQLCVSTLIRVYIYMWFIRNNVTS